MPRRAAALLLGRELLTTPLGATDGRRLFGDRGLFGILGLIFSALVVDLVFSLGLGLVGVLLVAGLELTGLFRVLVVVVLEDGDLVRSRVLAVALAWADRFCA